MKERESNMYLVLFCMLLVMGWMFIFYAPLRTSAQHTENMVNRKLNRIESRTQIPDLPNVSEESLIDRLDALETIKMDLLKSVGQNESRFVSLENTDGIKGLRLEISSLAEWAGLDVVRFGNLDSNDDITDSIQAIQKQIRKPFGRPVQNLEAKGRFPQIADFVHSIGSLQQSASVLRMEIIAPEFDEVERNPELTGILTLHLELAL